jgi:hypothetical protein
MPHRTGLQAGSIAVLVCLVLCGCGGSSASAALHDPSIRGVEALRQAVRSALRAHNYQQECELFAATLIDGTGGTIAKCAETLRSGWYTPYDREPQAYAAGGTIDMAGNVAVYRAGETEVFRAVYSEGAWRVVDDEQ